jgi:hypothetical protein
MLKKVHALRTVLITLNMLIADGDREAGISPVNTRHYNTAGTPVVTIGRT